MPADSGCISIKVWNSCVGSSGGSNVHTFGLINMMCSFVFLSPSANRAFRIFGKFFLKVGCRFLLMLPDSIRRTHASYAAAHRALSLLRSMLPVVELKGAESGRMTQHTNLLPGAPETIYSGTGLVLVPWASVDTNLARTVMLFCSESVAVSATRSSFEGGRSYIPILRSAGSFWQNERRDCASIMTFSRRRRWIRLSSSNMVI